MVVEQSDRPTLRTISELTGFAVPTVSRALKGAPDIGRSTKETVQRVAREIGYVPNRAGVRLKTGKTHVISLVLSTDRDIMSHTARLISGIAEALRDTHYHMIVTPTLKGEDPLKPVRYIVETGSADAIILNQTEPEDARVAYLMAHGFPFATHGRTNQSHLHPYFDFDNDRYGRIAVKELAARGRRHILLVAPPTGQMYARHMIAAAEDQARTCNIDLTRLNAATSDETTEVIQAAVYDHVTRTPGTDAILCGSTAAAMASVAAIEATGRAVAEDIDVLSKEALPFLKLFRPGIITLAEDATRAGEFLARAAVQAIDRPDLPPMQALDFPEKID